MTSNWAIETKGAGANDEVNGLNMLHGGLGSGEMVGPILPALTEHQPFSLGCCGSP
jgi:hypothetical protein